jgi:hypothetical protein
MDSDRDRTRDSVEQMEDREMKNPITDEDAALGEAGDALVPEGEEPERDKDDLEGPAPRTTQMPR